MNVAAADGLTAGADVGAALEAIVGRQHVSSHPGRLAEAGVTVAPHHAPAWLVKPGSAAEIAELVRLAGRHRIAVIPVGNAARSPRAAPLFDRPRFFVDSRRMSHVLHLDETSLIVNVQAGLTGLQLEKVLAPRGLSLGDYPPAALGSTVGGLLSVRTPGKCSPRHGFLEDAVLGVSAVLADGRSVHTRVAPRRSTGPDLARAFCGSEGTLGFITSAVLRIHRRPEARFLAAFRLGSFEAALSAVHLALREEAAPAALRVYDAAEARVHLGEGHAAPGEAVLVVATAGPTDLAACDRDLTRSAVMAVGGSRLAEAVAQTWWRRRTGRDLESPPPLPALQVTAPPSRQAAVYRAVLAAATATGAAARAHASRFDTRGGVMFFTLVDPSSGDPLTGEQAALVRAAAEEAAAESGAELLGHSNPMLSPYFAEMRRRLDPHRIMNPGALVA